MILVNTRVVPVKVSRLKKVVRGKVYWYDNHYIGPMLYIPKSVAEKYKEFEIERYDDVENSITIYVVKSKGVKVKVEVIEDDQ